MAFRIRFPIRCQALWIVLLGIATPWLFRRDHLREAVTTHAVNGRRNSSTTVMRRMLASIDSVEEEPVDLLLLRKYQTKVRE